MMQRKKIAPLALAVMLTATSAAGAANSDMVQAKVRLPGGLPYVLFEKLCEEVHPLFCFVRPSCPDETPDLTPEETPDLTPEETPDTEPEETPDLTPEETPDTPQKPGQGDTDSTPDADISQGDFASQVVALVNAERAKYGLSALTAHAGAQRAAQVRASEIVQSFSHTRPSGASFSTALTEAGVSYMRAGENIAYGQTSPEAVMQAWMNSSGHRANILSENFTGIGVGYTVVNGTAYWTQLFIA